MDKKELLKVIENAAKRKTIYLTLSDNNLSFLPPEIGELHHLIELNVSRNQLNSLPSEIGKLQNLQVLNVSYNQLNSLLPEIGKLQNLQILNIANNQLYILPPEIEGLPNLQRLNASDNQLTELPPQIGKLKNLTELNASTNKLNELPPEIGRLHNLIELRAYGNQLNKLSPKIGELQNLQRLYIHSNQLSELPPELGKLQNLRRLYISRNRLIELPPEIGELHNLTALRAFVNKLNTLPPEIDKLQNLARLDIHDNSLRELPPEISGLTSLIELVAYRNLISELPPEIGKLQYLQSLVIYSNPLYMLPPEIGRLQNLQVLHASKSQLSELPPNIGELKNLIELSVHENQISALSPVLCELQSLQRLYVSHNQLSELPPEIGKLQGLTALRVEGNPLESPPPEVVEQGTQAILAYLREQLEEQQPQWVSKLLLVGQGGVGKTQLLRRLRGEDFDNSIPTTHGIEVRKLRLAHPSEKDVEMQLNAWDFGGQEIYHATHQFFLTNRSLFLLVWNARHGFEQGKLYYWLDAIQARAPESPIIIVATQIDERDADLPLAEIKKKYPQVVAHYPVSNQTGEGIEELREAIIQTAAGLPLMGEVWPKTWLDAANAIRAREEKHITPQELTNEMKEHGVDEEGHRVLSQWLHELGDILYFREDEELNDLVILKPQWASTYISEVVDDEEVIEHSGVFTREQMETIWEDLHPSLRAHFLRLMEKFDLSYRTLEKREVSLVVERLPLDPPAYQDLWEQATREEPCNEIAIKYRLNTIPPGIPTWFIARSHRFTTHRHWRNGALFQHERERRHLALVQAFPHERYLQLSVRGANPHNFFALLKDGLELTLDRYPGLKIDRKIPCPGHDGEVCPHEFDYEQLLKRIEKNRLIIECPEALEDVDVRAMLFGLTPVTLDDVLLAVQKAESRDELHHSELIELVQREFMKNFRREQSQIDAYCPNVFTLRPGDTAGWKKALMGEKVELQLYCQQPGYWHPTETGGNYPISRPVEWLQKTAPYLKSLMSMLKYVSPFIGPWVGMADAAYKKLIAEDLKMMTELLKVMPDLIDDRDLDLVRKSEAVGDHEDMEHAHGAALRAIRQLLDEVDPSQNWGNLRKVLTPEGHYLWLCEHHAKEYLI